MNGGNVPHDLQIHVRLVVCYNVSHPAHPAEGQFGDGLPGGFTAMRGRFADDFEAANDGILLLGVRAEILNGS